MKPTALSLGLGVTLGLLVGGVGSQGLHAQQPPIKRTELQKVDLAGAQGQEGVLARVEIAPGATVPKHFHPGDVFVYVLQGTFWWEADGGERKTFKAGDSFHVMPKHVHSEGNASPSEPATLMAFFVKPKGEPLSVTVGEAVSGTSPTSGASTSGAQPGASPK